MYTADVIVFVKKKAEEPTSHHTGVAHEPFDAVINIRTTSL